MVREALDTRMLLEKVGIRATVVNCSTVNPMDEAMLLRLADKPMFTMEEHMLRGGFGSAVCAWCAVHGKAAPKKMFGISDEFVTHGKRVLLLRDLGLLPEQMADHIERILK